MPGAPTNGSICSPTSTVRPRQSPLSPGRPKPTGFRTFCARAQRIYRTLDGPFMRAQKPSALSLAAGTGLCRDVGHLALRHAMESARRTFPRPPAAPVVRPLCHLQRIVAVPGTGDADADRACRAAGCLAGRRRHGAPGARRLPTWRPRLGRRSLRVDARCAKSPSAPAARPAWCWTAANGSKPTQSICNADCAALATGALGRAAIGAVPRRSRTDGRCRR